MASIAEIDLRMAELDAQVGELVDVEVLAKQLREGPGASLSVRELGELNSRDLEIAKQLEQLQELWIITQLKKEVEVNLGMFEFETVFSSLKKLDDKVGAISANSSVVKTKWVERSSELRDQAIETLTKTWNKLVDIEGAGGYCSITFNESVEIDGWDITYESIQQVVQDYALPQNVFNLSHSIDSHFITGLFTSGTKLQFGQKTLSFLAYNASGPTDLLKTQIESTRAIVDFVNLIPQPSKIISYISPRVNEKLHELITDHADVIYVSEDLRAEFHDLGDYLQSHKFTRNDLRDWISSDLHGITIDHYLNQHIQSLREVFINPDFSLVTRTTHHITEASSGNPEKQGNTQSNFSTSTKTEVDGNNDDDDDDDDNDGWGWGDDDDEDGDKEREEENDEKQGNGDDNDWDDWGEDDEDEEVRAKPKKKLVSKLSAKTKSATSRETTPLPQKQYTSVSFQTSTIPDKVLAIIESYVNTANHISQEQHSQHLSKVDYLTTTFFMLGSVSYPTPLLQYNDISYLHRLHPLPSLKDLSDRLLMNFIKAHEREIESHFFRLNGLDPSISAGDTMRQLDAIQSALDDTFKDLSILENGVFNSIVISVMSAFYQLVIDSVMSKGDIGEQESEYLARVIQDFLKLKQPLGASVEKYAKNWEKLRKMSSILTGHLKDIMDMFYQGDLYEFETEELVSLIDKLFADSDLKRGSIKEIRELREEDV